MSQAAVEGAAVGDNAGVSHVDGAREGDDVVDILFASLEPASALQAVSFTIERASADVAICRLFDGSEAFLPASEWFPNRRMRQGDAAVGVLNGARSLSVVRPELVELLVAGLVPEVRSGAVQIRGVARLPGVRSKLAAVSCDPQVDPVAACVGRKANRVRALTSMLGGERIDVVPWSADREQMLRAALAPAQVSRIVLDGRQASVFVPAHRMASTVGAGGLNAQLAGRLAGFKVQVFPEP